MGVREFDAVCTVTSKQTSKRTDPESWEGYDSDPFWQDAHRAG